MTFDAERKPSYFSSYSQSAWSNGSRIRRSGMGEKRGMLVNLSQAVSRIEVPLTATLGIGRLHLSVVGFARESDRVLNAETRKPTSQPLRGHSIRSPVRMFRISYVIIGCVNSTAT